MPAAHARTAPSPSATRGTPGAPGTASERLACTIANDAATREHVFRVREYASLLARALGIEDDRTLTLIEDAALLHDVGKLAIPRHILNKPGSLTAVEIDTMRQHVDIGAGMLLSLGLPATVVLLVRCHHENWDGTGYPQGLRGDAIPLGARILAVADRFDALASDRSYRRALPQRQAIQMIYDRRGTDYDPLIVDVFERVYGARLIHDAGLAVPSRTATQHVPTRRKRSSAD